MSNEKHTPTPWRLDERIRMAQIYAGPERNCLATGAEVVASWGHELTDQERANAAFIVRACNSHEALVKALEELTAKCERGGNVPMFPLSVAQARAALKQAKENA